MMSEFEIAFMKATWSAGECERLRPPAEGGGEAVPRSNQGAGRYHHLAQYKRLFRVLSSASLVSLNMSSYDQYRGRNDSYPPQQHYTDQADGAFNPYDNAPPHQSYEQGGYQDADYRDEPVAPAAPEPPAKEKESSTYASTGEVPTRYIIVPMMTANLSKHA